MIDIKDILSSCKEGEMCALVIECDEKAFDEASAAAPEHVKVFNTMGGYKFFVRRNPEVKFVRMVIVSPKHYDGLDLPVKQHYPSVLHLGVGCQKDAPVEIAKKLLSEVETAGYAREAIATINTIEAKKDEAVVAELGRMMPRATTHIYQAEELAKVKIPNPSQRVFASSGCYCVAEASAKAHDKHSRLVIENQKGKIEVAGKIAHYTFALAMDEPLQN